MRTPKKNKNLDPILSPAPATEDKETRAEILSHEESKIQEFRGLDGQTESKTVKLIKDLNKLNTSIGKSSTLSIDESDNATLDEIIFHLKAGGKKITKKILIRMALEHLKKAYKADIEELKNLR